MAHQAIKRALAFDRSIRVRGAERSTAIAGGVVVRHDKLRSKWILNAVMLDAPLTGIDAAAVAALADEHLRDLAHRYVVLDDAAAGEPIARELVAAGWHSERVVFLRWPAGAAVPSASPGRRLEAAELRSIQLATALGERGAGAVAESLSESLVAGEEALRAATPWAAFGAGPDGRVASSCTLFFERPACTIAPGRRGAGTAMLDEVGTLSADRGRGYARAAVAAALAHAMELGCDPIVIGALADDWPIQWYSRLGFEPIGEQLSLSLPAVS